jgi:hypothetical protein
MQARMGRFNLRVRQVHLPVNIVIFQSLQAKTRHALLVKIFKATIRVHVVPDSQCVVGFLFNFANVNGIIRATGPADPQSKTQICGLKTQKSLFQTFAPADV